MPEMYFNAKGKTHTLRLLDYGDDGIWEAMVDVDDYVYFEAEADAEIWDLIALAAKAYNEYRRDDSVERKEWKSGLDGRPD